MKRDMDLVRTLLFELEKQSYIVAASGVVNIDGYDDEAIHYHLRILTDSPYVMAQDVRGTPNYFRLTWEGHEFLESIRDDTRWNQLKEASTKAGAASIDAIAKAALAMGIKLIFGYVGLPVP